MADPNSIASELVFGIITENRADELTIFERLYVAEHAGVVSHAGWHADLYMKCGCLQEALRQYESVRHIRKLGDISWAMGDLDAAARYYATPADRRSQSSRFDKDWDRLIKLSFVRSDWHVVLHNLRAAPLTSSPVGKCRIVLGRSEVAGTPYLKMMAIACAQIGSASTASFKDLATSVFGLTIREWTDLVAASALTRAAEIRKLQTRAAPMPASKPLLSLSEAFTKGQTPRALTVLDFLKDASNHISRARRDVRVFLQTGAETHLQGFLRTVLLSGVTSIGRSMLFHCLERDMQGLGNYESARLVKLYGCHPIMNKRYFGHLLASKFTLRSPISGSDVLTGIFQRMGSIESSIAELDERQSQGVLDYPKLAACRDWALMQLHDWVTQDGSKLAQQVAQAWRTKTFRQVSGPFYNGERDPESPRNMAEWASLLDTALQWLGNQWSSEIGSSPWISENRLFHLLKRSFKPLEVLQHAQPLWLAPQHLDVFIPERALAIEFMGKQHYEPIEFFGGETGFRQTIERDRRKAELCERVAIRLVYVRYDEDIEQRVTQIRAKHLA